MSTIEVAWDDRLEADLLRLYADLRYHTPAIGDCSTPLLIEMEQKHERRRAAAFLKNLRKILTEHRPPSLDCEVIDAMARLQDKAAAR